MWLGRTVSVRPMLQRDVAPGVHRVEDAFTNAYLVEDGDAVFTFDNGDVLIVENIANPNLLRDDIVFI